MSMRNTLALLAAGVVPFLTACGGGSSNESAAPAATSAPAAGAPAAGAAAGGSGTGSGTISGKIAFDGTAPAPDKVKVTADPKCAAMHKDGLEKQTIKVTNGGLAEVLVYVKSGVNGSYPAPTEAALLDQKGCNYSPLVLAVQAGQSIKIRNSDDTLHNIHPRPTTNEEFNFGQPKQGSETEKKFDKPELSIPVGCDVHPWMRAYIHVLSNPFFAVTKEDGSYEIKGLPDGDYEVEALHAKLPPVSQKVSIKGGQAAKLDLTVKG
jgi:hypothetical protein